MCTDMVACMQARQALTGALKIWWDQSQLHRLNNDPDWQPALLPSIFVGAKAAAMDRNVDPNQVGTLVCAPLTPVPAATHVLSCCTLCFVISWYRQACHTY